MYIYVHAHRAVALPQKLMLTMHGMQSLKVSPNVSHKDTSVSLEKIKKRYIQSRKE